MLVHYRKIQLALNIRNCIFYTSIRILLGKILCKEGIKVDLAKIKVILNLKHPINPKQVMTFLGHTRYYRKFMKYYSHITFPMDELLRENAPLIWSKECTNSFEMLNRKMGESPIMSFPK